MASYWQIFITFAKIGAFTIGGGYAMLPIIQNEIVRRGWLKEEDFTDIVALAQSAPGLLAVNISIFTGHKLRGTKGSIVATLGSILPSFLIILAIAMLFSGYQDNPTVIKIFKGIRPVVVALIAVPMINMAKTANRKWWAWLLSAVTLALVAFLKISPIYILLTVIVVAAAVSWWRTKH
ncbi:MAG: chromate transporter [Prevotella sp.]|nr:chromate transporter [Prevotella sp.]